MEGLDSRLQVSPSTRRRADIVDSIARLQAFCSRASFRSDLSTDGVEVQLNALRGLPDPPSEARSVVFPKQSVLLLSQGMKSVVPGWPVYNQVMKELLRVGPAAVKSDGAFLDGTCAVVGQKHLQLDDDRTSAFYRYTEGLPGDLVVMRLEIRRSSCSADALRNDQNALGKGEFWVDPYAFGVALLSGQLRDWSGRAACIACVYRPSSKRFDRVPYWYHQRFTGDQTGESFRFGSQLKTSADYDGFFPIGFAPESVLCQD